MQFSAEEEFFLFKWCLDKAHRKRDIMWTLHTENLVRNGTRGSPPSHVITGFVLVSVVVCFNKTWGIKAAIIISTLSHAGFCGMWLKSGKNKMFLFKSERKLWKNILFNSERKKKRWAKVFIISKIYHYSLTNRHWSLKSNCIFAQHANNKCVTAFNFF